MCNLFSKPNAIAPYLLDDVEGFYIYVPGEEWSNAFGESSGDRYLGMNEQGETIA